MAPGKPATARPQRSLLLPRLAVQLQQRLANCKSIDEFVAIVEQELRDILPVRDRVSIAFRDLDGEHMRFYRILPGHVGPIGRLPRVRIEGTPVGEGLTDGKARICDVRKDAVVTLGHASRDGIRSTISAPIRIGSQIVGVINAGAYEAGTCTKDMLARLEEIVGWVGPAIYAADQMLSVEAIDEPLGCAMCSAGEVEWPTLDEMQAQYISRVLERCGGMIEGSEGAAHLLGLRPSTLRSRMNRLGVSAQPMRRRKNS